MGYFLHHAPCPKCNSKDNLGVYSDGSLYCFGCRFYRSNSTSPHGPLKKETKEPNHLPKDLTTDYAQEAVEWCLSYGILPEELILHDVKWSPSTKQLIFLIPSYEYLSYSDQNKTVSHITFSIRSSTRFNRSSRTDTFPRNRELWKNINRTYSVTAGTGETNPRNYESIEGHTTGTQAPCQENGVGRIFSKGNKQKYKNYFKETENPLFAFYHCPNGAEPPEHGGSNCVILTIPDNLSSRIHRRRSILVLVEDCLSAIKIARQNDSLALLTSGLSTHKINLLAKHFDTFLVWLDGNMFHKAQTIARKFQLLGKNATAIYTKEDPKCHTNEEILDILTKNVL